MDVVVKDANQLKNVRLRKSGKRGFTVAFPAQIADVNGLVPGTQFKVVANPSGEVVFTPIKGE